MHKICAVFLSILMLFSFCACSLDPQEMIEYRSDKDFVNSYAKELEGVTSCEYEKIREGYQVFGSNYSMGPSEPRYRGIIYLDEESGKELFDSYNWLLDDTFVYIDLGNINTPPLQGADWYYCQLFENDKFYMVISSTIRFNGKDTIIFDVQSH